MVKRVGKRAGKRVRRWSTHLVDLIELTTFYSPLTTAILPMAHLVDLIELARDLEEGPERLDLGAERETVAQSVHRGHH